MEQVKVEEWNGKNIRFLFIGGEWLAVGKDIAEALGYEKPNNAINKHCDDTPKRGNVCDKLGRSQKMRLITELDIYNLIFNSELPEAKAFKKWVFDLIKSLREQAGLEGYQIFTMTDKQHQKDAMDKIKDLKPHAKSFDYINANKLANEVVRKMYGLDKGVKKGDFNLKQLESRKAVMDIITSVTELKTKNKSDISVRATVLAMFDNSGNKANLAAN